MPNSFNFLYFLTALNLPNIRHFSKQQMQLYDAYSSERTMTMQPTFSYASMYPYTCNKALYVAMALLFGSLGIHKFCAGRVWMGIFYLLFSWTFIPAVLGVIEGIMAAFKPTDSLGAIVV